MRGSPKSASQKRRPGQRPADGECAHALDMRPNDCGPRKRRGSRHDDDALARLDAAAKQLEIAREKADGKWQEAAIGALRADLATLQGFATASRRRTDRRFGPEFHESPEVSDDD